MNEDRRHHLRKVPDKFAFVQIERDEVGKVLNVSEGGLSFNTFAPVPQYGPLYFWLSFNLKDRIEGMGELVWTDSSRKIGGLRFVRLSKSSREQIHKWLSRLPSQQGADMEPVPRVVPKRELAKRGASKFDRVAKFVSKARIQHFPASLDSGDRGDSSVLSQHFPPTFKTEDRGISAGHLHYVPISLGGEDREETSAPSPALPGMESSGGLVPIEQYHSAKKRQLVRGVLIGVGISALVMLAGLGYSSYRHRGENTKVATVESPLPRNDLPALPSAPQSGASASAAYDPFSGGQQAKGVASKSTSTKQVAASYAYSQSHPQTIEPKAQNQVARTPGQSLSGPSSALKRPMTPAQLWAAVQAGNSKAAVDLADLYIKGEGVPQNCQQARVLLLVASEKRNAAAIKRLQELDKDANACP